MYGLTQMDWCVIMGLAAVFWTVEEFGSFVMFAVLIGVLRGCGVMP